MTDQPEHNGGRAAHALAVARGLVAALRAAGEDLDDPRPRGAGWRVDVRRSIVRQYTFTYRPRFGADRLRSW